MFLHWLDIYYYSTDKYAYPLNTSYFLSLLDDYEKTRFERYAFDHLKWTFATTRWIVKTHLAEKLNCPPKSISFSYTDNGKPYLEENSDIYFSLSHTISGIAVALSNRDVGVDLEMHQRRGDPWKEAGNFLNLDIERKINTALTEKEKMHCFTRYWTALEALVKLKGSTLFQEKECFGKALDCMSKDGSYSEDGFYWQTHDIDSVSQLTVCTQKKPERIRCNIFNGENFSESSLFV